MFYSLLSRIEERILHREFQGKFSKTSVLWTFLDKALFMISITTPYGDIATLTNHVHWVLK